MSAPTASSGSPPASGAAGVSFLILSQVATKAFTFGSNQLLVRNISPEIFGIASYLEFIVESVLFFSREAERNAIQRVTAENAGKTRQIIVNFAHIPLVLGLPIAVAMFWLQKSSSMYAENIAPLPFASYTIALTVGLILLELVAEPLYALNQYSLNFKTRSKIESSAVFVRCMATLGGVLLARKWASDRQFDGLAVAAFAGGHFAYSAVTLIGYLALALFQVSAVKKVEEKKDNESSSFWLDPATLSLWKSLFVQMIFKHLLTEGDHLVVSYLFDVGEQGVYSVIENYGSIVARLLFQPIEESLRMTFTKTFARKDADLPASYKLMENLLVFYSNLCLLLVLGGYTNGGFLLRQLLGRNEKWQGSSVFEYFPQFVLYLPFLAFNGILEAFFSSASTQKQIGSFSAFMSVSSFAVLALLYVLVEKYLWGLAGLIAANMANMTLRIVYCFVYLVFFYQKNKVTTNFANIMQRLVVPVLSVATSFGIQQKVFNQIQSNNFEQFFQSVGLCFFCLGAMIYSEKDALRASVVQIRTKKE